MSEVYPRAPSFFIRHHPEPERPVSLHLSRTVNWRVLCHLGEGFRELMPPQFESREVGVMAVATGGISLSFSVAQTLFRNSPYREVHLTEINPMNPVASNFMVTRDIPTVVVDNSIKSGETASRVLSILNTCDIHPDVYLKPFDHQDDLETTVLDNLRRNFPQTTFMSLFTLDEAREQFADHIATID